MGETTADTLIAAGLDTPAAKALLSLLGSADKAAVIEALEQVIEVRTQQQDGSLGLRAALDAEDWTLCAEILDSHPLELFMGGSRELCTRALRGMSVRTMLAHPAAAVMAEIVGLLPPDPTWVVVPPCKPGEIQRIVTRGDSRRILERVLLDVRACWDRGRYQDALALVKGALPLAEASTHTTAEPILHLWYAYAGLTVELAGDFTLARLLMRRGAELAPSADFPWVQDALSANLALLSAWRGEVGEARRWLARYEGSSPAPDGSPRVLERAHAAAQIVVALESMDQVTAEYWAEVLGDPVGPDPQWPLEVWALGRLLLMARRSGESELKLLDDAAAAHQRELELSDGIHAHLMETLRAECLGFLSMPRAIAVARTVPTDGPLGAYAAWVTAQTLHTAGKDEEALATAVRALPHATYPRATRMLLATSGASAAALGRDEDAIGLWCRLAKISTPGEGLRNWTVIRRELLEPFRDRIPGLDAVLDPIPDLTTSVSALQLVELTRRETIILRELALGYDRPTIAKRLVVSPNTVHTQLKSVYAKLGVSSSTAAISRATELGLLLPHGTGRASS